MSKITGWLRSFVHNAMVHPLMMFLPAEMGNNVHDKNANWAFNDRYDEMGLEGRR